MFYLVEKDDSGNEVARHNLETGETLTKPHLLALLKTAYDNPERFEVIKDEDFVHPSEGVEPKDHMDAGDLIDEFIDDIGETGYELKKGDFQRIAMALSKAFKKAYGVPPREVIRQSRNVPGQWTSKKQAYPPVFFEDARALIIKFCEDQKEKQEKAKKRAEREKRLGRKEYIRRGKR
jgi:AraC-like DNA-binding protein